jgi:ribosomal protein S18 acetylase RimI-like enzyme
MPEENSLEQGGPVSLRPVTPDDEAFLLRVYSSTRMEEMALVPWSEEQREVFLKSQFNAQQQHYQSHFPNARHEIVECAGQPVGRLYVLRTDEFMRILDLTILPEFRGAGIGTQLITDLKRESGAKGKPLHIYVESFNPSLRLFERLAFQKVEENGMHFLMEWNADQ